MNPVYSWLLGVAFGRFDKRLVTGERPIPTEPSPFEPLPSRSPGMWPEGEPRLKAPPEVLVDDPGHEADIVAHVLEAATHTGWLVPDDIRRWLARDFFAYHIKSYSKSRRKAPIYWQLATPSASYSVWLHLPSLSADTMYRVQQDYVAPKLAAEERKLQSLRHQAALSQRSFDREAASTQETFVQELRTMLEEVTRVAPLWSPNLDDGVAINFALLWRLVPHNGPWQEELKRTWDRLLAGDCDWAGLALSLWPERVIPKCAKDRSLAMAHGLTTHFWVDGGDGQSKPCTASLALVGDLVEGRSSPNTRAALGAFLTAPSDRAGARRMKRHSPPLRERQ